MAHYSRIDTFTCDPYWTGHYHQLTEFLDLHKSRLCGLRTYTSCKMENIEKQGFLKSKGIL